MPGTWRQSAREWQPSRCNFRQRMVRKEFVGTVKAGLAQSVTSSEATVSDSPTFVIKVWHWIKRFGLMLIAVVISLLIKENYPFSHNPMYSKFDPYTYFLHVTDENGQVLYFRDEFGYSAVRLKKVFRKKFDELRKNSKTKELPREEHFRIAGEDTLQQYHRQRMPRVENPAQYQMLKLVRTDIELVPGEVAKEEAIIAEITIEAEANQEEGAQP